MHHFHVLDSDRESLLSEMEEDSDIDPDFELSNAERVGSELSSSNGGHYSYTSTEVISSGNTILSDSDASDEIPVQPYLTRFLEGHQSESNKISFGLFPKGQKKENCKQIYDKIHFFL